MDENDQKESEMIDEMKEVIIEDGKEQVDAKCRIHKSLISSGALDTKFKMFELKKQFYPSSDEENGSDGTLKLEMAGI